MTDAAPSSKNRRQVPTFEGRLYAQDGSHAGNWVRRAEVDVLLDEIAALQSLWDDMQQGFVEVFGEPVRDAIELLGAVERIRSGHETTPDVVKACHATIGVLARRVVQMGQPLRDHACAACMPEGGPLVTVGFTCAFHLASYLVTCPEYQLPDSGQKAEPLQGPYCPDTNQPCDRMCQSICNRRECAHEFLPTAGQALSETDPRCIKCHRRWSSVNGRPQS